MSGITSSSGLPSIHPIQTAQPTTNIVKPELKTDTLKSITKEQFTAIGKKVDGGDTALLNKLKEIDPSKDFAKILGDGGKIDLSTSQEADLKEFVNDSAMIKSRKTTNQTDIAELNKNKPVTQDTTKTSLPLGNGKTRPILTGNSGSKLATLEDKLINPTSTDDRERLGIAARQKKIMEAAKKADPLMKQIESTGDLSQTHTNARKTPVLDKKNQPTSDYSFDSSNTLVHTATKTKQYSYGAEEFGNREVRGSKTEDKSQKVKTTTVDPVTKKKTITESTVVTPAEWGKKTDASETTVPVLTNNPNTKATAGDGVKSRVGVWSEADLNPRVQDGTTGKASGRDAERLLFTHKDSEVNDQVSRSSTSTTPIPTKKIDFQYHVTTDHYQTSVPITPVETDYKTKNNYTPKYDKTGAEIKPPKVN